MGIFNFGKKKDPLDDLSLPSDSSNSEFDSSGMHSQGEPEFQHADPVSSDPMSSPPNFSQPDNFSQPNQPNNQNNPSDLYSHYENAVNSSPQSFHSSEQNIQDNPKSNDGSVSHSTELVLSKLDVLKAMIENLGHRIENLEQKYDRDKEERKKSW